MAAVSGRKVRMVAQSATRPAPPLAQLLHQIAVVVQRVTDLAMVVAYERDGHVVFGNEKARRATRHQLTVQRIAIVFGGRQLPMQTPVILTDSNSHALRDLVATDEIAIVLDILRASRLLAFECDVELPLKC